MKKNIIVAVLAANPNADYTITLASKALKSGKIAIVGDDAVSITLSDTSVQYVGIDDIKHLSADSGKIQGSENATIQAALRFWGRAGLNEANPEYAIAKGDRETPPLNAYQISALTDRLMG